MNNTFVTWLLGAAVAGLAMLFLLGTPATVTEATASGSQALTTNGAAPAATSYWSDVTPTPASAAATSTASATTCASCSTTLTRAAAVVTASAPASLSTSVGLAGGCGTPTAACAQAPCRSIGSCATSMSTSLSVPCPTASCASVTNTVSSCGRLACAAAACDDDPKINRNGPSCVDECSFTQLYSTVPLPVCSSIRFAWAATRGHFLDPAAAAPIYFAPGTGFPGGEDVLITLTVTDAEGHDYSDQMKLHVNDAH